MIQIRRQKLQCLALMLGGLAQLACRAESSPAANNGSRPIEIGDRRELFLDEVLIQKMSGVRLALNPPLEQSVAFRFDKPWEGPFCGYCTVIKDGPTYRMYYRGKPNADPDGSSDEVTCYAESTDGIHWNKPEFNLPNAPTHPATNIVLADSAPISHNFSPMLDTRPGVPPE